MVGYGFGFCLLELFAQLGSGINTKAVSVVGANLIGKVEKKIPKNDPRSPTIIINLVSLQFTIINNFTTLIYCLLQPFYYILSFLMSK
jgi:hypothetical protein